MSTLSKAREDLKQFSPVEIVHKIGDILLDLDGEAIQDGKRTYWGSFYVLPEVQDGSGIRYRKCDGGVVDPYRFWWVHPSHAINLTQGGVCKEFRDAFFSGDLGFFSWDFESKDSEYVVNAINAKYAKETKDAE